MKNTQIIGSDPKADISIKSRYIAAKHAFLTKEGNQFFIEDNQSTFGTHINGKKITEKTALKPKDRIKLGIVPFHWRDYIGELEETEKNPLFVKDLFSIYGIVNWHDYKLILLIALGAAIIIPIGIPLLVLFTDSQLGEYMNFYPAQYSEILIWTISLIAIYIFLNLTQKMIRGLLQKKS